jgi:O-antigen ligase
LSWSPGRWAAAAVQVGVFAVALVWSFHLLRRPEPLRPAFALFPIMGILGFGVLQLAFRWTVYRWDTWNALLYWFTNLLAFLISLDLSRDSRTRIHLLQWVFLFGVMLAVVSTIQLFSSEGLVFWVFPTGYRDSVLGPFVSRNQFAAFLELLVPIAFFRSLERGAVRPPYLLTTAALYACAIASASRAGAVLATMELIVIGAVLIAKRLVPLRSVARPLAALLLLCGLFTAIVGPQTLWRRLTEDPYSGRGEFLAASLTMARERPWTGFGLGCWSTVYPAYASSDDGTFVNQAHNDWAQAAVEGGLPVFLCMLAFLFWGFWASAKCVWGSGIVFVLLHALVDYPIQRTALGAFFFLFAGILAGAAESARSAPGLHTETASSRILKSCGGDSDIEVSARSAHYGCWD